ncbi:hemicentin-1 [Archocentrus centrarchus]|uniref:hemicentin-1 n=1 Tax=Archocentrus centrarchus TaxID=63155 RepID=UPI0011E9D7A3|nr:hemicentin-1-like [Archocentrus centrarchus]
MFPGESIIFTCSVSVSSGWEYLWYRGDQDINTPNTDTYNIPSIRLEDKGQYHCKARRGQLVTDASDSTTLEVSQIPVPAMTERPRWQQVFPTESVSFSCAMERDSSNWIYTWYKDGEQVQADGSVSFDANGAKLSISSASANHKGQYKCSVQLQNRAVRSQSSSELSLTVHGEKPTLTLTKDPDYQVMFPGESVTFSCAISVSSDWQYLWYKDGIEISGSSDKLLVKISATADGGSYTCKARRGPNPSFTTDSSKAIQLQVRGEKPTLTLTKDPDYQVMFPGESVTFSCAISVSSEWQYLWYKDGSVLSESSDKLLVKISATADGGLYTCKARRGPSPGFTTDSSKAIQLQVRGEKPTLTLTKDPEYQVMFPGESVTFSCAISVSSEWQYLWYKDGIEIPGSSDKHLVKISATADGGSYTCKAKRGANPGFTTDSSKAIQLQVRENKPTPSITRQPDAKKLYMGEPVSFECKVEISSGWSYEWYKNGTSILNNQSLNMNNLSWSNSGTYKCVAKRKKTNFTTNFSEERTLPLSEIPVPTLKPVTKWMDVFPTENATMTCGMEQDSTDWTYAWYRDGNKVQDYYSKNDRNFSITSASASDRGRYSCSGKLKSRKVYSKESAELVLVVYGEKPKVTLVQNPKHDLMHSEDSVSFNCHVNVSTGWEYLWYKDDRQLDSSGSDHNISSVVTTNSGSYTCKVKRGMHMVFYSDLSNNVKLKVVERPKASIVLLTGWSEVFSTDSLVLKCEVMESTDMWNYTWSKEGEKIESAYSERHIVTPQNDPDQSMYTCHGIRNERPLYSKTSDSFKTKNLLLKRRVLLSISGCIFFGIIAVLIGCVALRIFRRPAAADDRAEEVNLFPTMAQLKITDAPCPLVDYITDASLNAPVKEEEENGTVCNETTPLPITKQEDQAATNDSQETTETNGGLLSFQK